MAHAAATIEGKMFFCYVVLFPLLPPCVKTKATANKSAPGARIRVNFRLHSSIDKEHPFLAMAYQPELEPGENVRCQVVLDISKGAPPFHFAVSDQAVYWPATRFLPVNDSFYFRRITHNRIQEVTICKLTPYGFLVLGVLLVAGGIFFLVTGGRYAPEGSMGAIVGGVYVLFAARGRYGLNIVTSEKTFRWEPPPAADRVSKEKVASMLTAISEACRGAGLRVQDQR
jgi:hypothetical protein